MVGRIGVIALRNKLNQMILRIPHRISFSRNIPVVNAGMKKLFRLCFIIENAFSISPAVGRKKQRHGEKFFPVRSRSIGIFRSIRLAGPGKISGVNAFFHVHIGLCPFPQAVKFFFFIHLDTHHHAVGHTFRSGIMISCILHIAHVVSHRMINPFLLRSVKHGGKCLFNLAVNGFLGIAVFQKNIPVNSRFKGSLAFGRNASLRLF